MDVKIILSELWHFIRYNIVSLFGISLALVSLLICIALFGNVFGDPSGGIALSLGFFVFFALTCCAGVYIGLTSLYEGRRYRYACREKRLLEVIALRGGRVTPEEIAMNSDFTVSEAKEALEQLCSGGFAEIQLTAEGKMLYAFSGFISEYEKQTAKSALEL